MNIPKQSYRLIRTTTLSLAALLGSCLASHASPQVSASSGASHLDGSPANTASSGGVSHASSGADETRYGSFSASASFSGLSTYGQIATIPYNSSVYAGVGSGRASFRDDFLFDAPGLTGTAGSVTVRFTISGTLAVTKNGTPNYSAAMSNTFAEAAYAFGVDLDSSNQVSQRRRWDGTSSGTLFLGVPQERTLNFTFGTTLENVMLRISSTVAAAGEGFTYASNSTSDLSAAWGGFVEVRDNGGNVVSNYSFSSSSGSNYVQPVPEPASAALVLLGGAMFVGTRRSRSTRQ